jgi:hypothetical protein
MNLKCISCRELERQKMGDVVVYFCKKFPYPCPLEGLLKPGEAVSKAAMACQEDPLASCVICHSEEIIKYGGDIVAICPKHDGAWAEWLKSHPSRYEHMSRNGKAVKEAWVEVFREFVEDMKNAIKR